jgi:P-type conjugative transfer protein TrbG
MTSTRPSLLGLALTPLLTLSSAATAQQIDSGGDPNLIAASSTVPVGTTRIVPIPVPLPLPGQLKPLPQSRIDPAAVDPQSRVSRANAAARIQPGKSGYLNAIQRYPYAEGALYQLYATPGQVTDIAMQDGEEMVGAGPIAAGDTARWIIGDTVSGAGATRKVHILVKPTQDDIDTNLVINTDRRTYHLELHSTPSTYMASIAWIYPQDALFALQGVAEREARSVPAAGGVDLAAINFDYRISGDMPDWRPLRVFDDGRQVMIEFPANVGVGQMPPLFVSGAAGTAELVNYRVQGRYMVVDRLFASAELRLGDRKKQRIVRIDRFSPKTRRREKAS